MKELLRKLIEAETTAAKGELAAAEIISEHLGQYGIESDVQVWDRTRANLVAHIKSTGRKRALLFACHLDVVPPGEASWEHPAFRGTEENGRIYGRGSADMKGGITAVVTAIRELVNSRTSLNGDIVLFAAAGEETDSCGAKRFVQNYGKKLPHLAGVVIPEPTDFAIVTAHRGLLWLEVGTRGRSTHGSTPQLGVNAIASMNTLLNELQDYQVCADSHELLGRSSVSVNTINGGEAINVVPDRCRLGIDIRTLPGQKHQDIIADFERIFAKLKQEDSEFDAQVSVVRDVEALETDENCDFVRGFRSAVGIEQTSAAGFCTDGPFLASLAGPVVIFGPGKPDLCHRPDEYIEMSDLEKAVEYYKSIMLKFLS